VGRNATKQHFNLTSQAHTEPITLITLIPKIVGKARCDRARYIIVKIVDRKRECGTFQMCRFSVKKHTEQMVGIRVVYAAKRRQYTGLVSYSKVKCDDSIYKNVT